MHIDRVVAAVWPSRIWDGLSISLRCEFLASLYQCSSTQLPLAHPVSGHIVWHVMACVQLAWAAQVRAPKMAIPTLSTTLMPSRPPCSLVLCKVGRDDKGRLLGLPCGRQSDGRGIRGTEVTQSFSRVCPKVEANHDADLTSPVCHYCLGSCAPGVGTLR